MTKMKQIDRPQQRGFVTVAAVMLLVLGVMFWFMRSYDIIGTTSQANAVQGNSAPALFLAESGVEVAMARIEAANKANSYTSSTCNGLKTTPLKTIALDNGTFTFLDATCGGDASCSDCTIRVQGDAAPGRRTIEAVISTVMTEGESACDATPHIQLIATGTKHGIFTNLAYRAKDSVAHSPFSCTEGGGGPAATVDTCEITTTTTNPSPPPATLTTSVATCVPASYGWDLMQTGDTNVSGLGVFTALNDLDIGTLYSVDQTLVGTGTTAAPRNNVQTGVVVSPFSGRDILFVGAYGNDTGSSKTVGTSANTSGSVPSNWNCATPADGTATLARAAGASTLVYGFSSWPQVANAQLSALTLGTQPFRRQLSMTSNEPDHLYSQIWYSYNRDYYSGAADADLSPNYYATGSTLGASNGATFTGASGAVFTGTITAGTPTTNPATLTVTAITGSSPNPGSYNRFGELNVGDQIKNAAGTVMHGTITTACTGTIPALTCQLSPVTSDIPTGQLHAWSAHLRVSSVASGVLSQNDQVLGGTRQILAFPQTGTTGMGFIGNYLLTDRVAPFNTTSNMTSVSDYSIYIPDAGLPAGLTEPPWPLDGTALQVASGTGSFDSAIFTGAINSNVLTVSGCTSETPSVGDALFGPNVKPDTRITGPYTGTGACDNGTTYPVNTDHPAMTSATIVARAAVNSGLAVFNGSISGNTMNVDSVTSGTLNVGNAVWSAALTGNIRIMAQTTIVGANAGGAGTYAICKIPSAGLACSPVSTVTISGGFTSGASPNFYRTSRIPSTRLSGTAQICGGVCMILRSGTTFNLGLTGGDDWASGFACVAGTDPVSIKTLGIVSTKRTSWKEVVQLPQ